MEIKPASINCQDPVNPKWISRVHHIVQCRIEKETPEYEGCMIRALELAQKVNPGAANDTDYVRGDDRLSADSFGGVLAEQGWLQYINEVFGPIAERVPFTSATKQIDIKLRNGELLEVRSSFPNNGVKFAICNQKNNFKNIGPYSNSIKPTEIQKHFYLGVLFDTQKTNLFLEGIVCFSLIGGSTWQMMVNKGRNDNLKPEGVFVSGRSLYRVLEFQDALDVSQVMDAICGLGYKKLIS